jgi:hypothetical protein
MPTNGGLLRIGGRSPGSEFGHFRLGIADSLRPIFEIFPFSADGEARKSAPPINMINIMLGLAAAEAYATSAREVADFCKPCKKSAARWAWDAAAKIARLSSFRTLIHEAMYEA